MMRLPINRCRFDYAKQEAERLGVSLGYYLRVINASPLGIYADGTSSIYSPEEYERTFGKKP
jgi:hypothetical protein